MSVPVVSMNKPQAMWGGDAGAVVQLARIGLGVGDELRHRPRRHVRLTATTMEPIETEATGAKLLTGS